MLTKWLFSCLPGHCFKYEHSTILLIGKTRTIDNIDTYNNELFLKGTVTRKYISCDNFMLYLYFAYGADFQLFCIERMLLCTTNYHVVFFMYMSGQKGCTAIQLCLGSLLLFTFTHGLHANFFVNLILEKIFQSVDHTCDEKFSKSNNKNHLNTKKQLCVCEMNEVFKYDHAETS